MPSDCVILPLFVISTAHFSIPNFIPMSPLNILTVCISKSSWFEVFAYNFKSSINRRWLIFILFPEDYPASHFLRMRVRGIIVITNSSGDKESPQKIPLFMSTLPRLCPFDVSSVFQPFIELANRFLIFWAMPTRPRHSRIHGWGIIS